MKALLLLALAGCFAAHETVCDDGTVCPASKVCAPAGGACVDPDQLHACDGKSDGDHCDLAGGTGVCHGGLCVVAGFCGDGIVTPPEVCDDGNTVSGDGCRADCQKVEMCGDGIVDQGEACDDANANPDDGCDACTATQWTATMLVGGGIRSTDSKLSLPTRIVVDAQRNMYIADSENNRIVRVDANSRAVTLVAGNGEPLNGTNGDGGPAVDARLSTPTGLAIDGLGNLYVAEAFHVRRIDALTGIITTIAGNGQMDQFGGEGDGGPAIAAHLRSYDVVLDGLGNIYVSSGPAPPGANRIRKIGLDGIITTYAGGGASFADGVPATQSSLTSPHGIVFDVQGRLYIADVTRVRMVDASGRISTVAGTGTFGYIGDGGPATSAQLNQANSVAVDGAGIVYIADTANHRVRMVDGGGTISTFAGTGVNGYAGDGGSATLALVGGPVAVATSAGTVLIGEAVGAVVRSVDAGTITTIAGTGIAGLGVTGEATSSTKIGYTYGLGVDAAGRVYVGLGDHISRIDPMGLTVVVGGGNSLADNVPATSAQIGLPNDILFDAAGNMYIAESSPCAVRVVNAATQMITTLASVCANSIARDSAGNTYASDTQGQVVRKITSGGVVSIVAGTGTASYCCDGQLATVATLNYPSGIALDTTGNLYIADRNNNRIRRVDHTSGLISTLIGTGTAGSAGDGGAANLAQLDGPVDVAFDASGNMYIDSSYDGRIRKVDTTFTISTVAGGFGFGFGGDLGPALQAGLGESIGVAVAPSGDLIIVDQPNGQPLEGHVRRIDHTTGLVSTLAGQVLPAGVGPITRARLADPGELVLLPNMMLVAGGRAGVVESVTATNVDLAIGRYEQAIPTGNRARLQSVQFGAVRGIALDGAGGKLYLTEDNRIDVVTLVDANDANTWTIAPLVGSTAGFADGAQPLFDTPAGLAFDATQHTLYVADTGNHVVRAVDTTTGQARTVAGTPKRFGFAGDGLAATAALLYKPTAVAQCGGRLYIGDTGNNRVRSVASSVIATVLGDGSRSSSGEGVPATAFPVDAPAGLACDSLGNLFVTSTATVRLLSANAQGIVDGTGSVETIYGKPPRDQLPQSVTRCLSGVAVVDDKTVRVTDYCAGMLLELTRGVKP